MILPIVKYGHPVLRQKGARIEKLSPAIRRLIDDMLETMESAHGVGLAAQQVGQALQLAVIDVSGVSDRPSRMTLDGENIPIEEQMPMVLINPSVTPLADAVSGPEGCLSFPELFADISRPESVEVSALDPKGQPVRFTCGGLLARAIQHELDHLNGILFIDRMSPADKQALKPELEELRTRTKRELQSK